MPTDYRYKKTGRFNSDIPQRFDFKKGCLIPFILFVIIISLIVGVSLWFDIK
jgi:hypothetical protein